MTDADAEIAENQADAAGHATSRAAFTRRWVTLILAVTALLCAGTVGAIAMMSRGPSHHSTTVPQNAAMEQQLGVRFTRVAVVGDGGLITLSYVVLDSEKASRFESDSAHRPVLTSESRPLSTKRVALMKQGHYMRPGATYYFVYENTDGALRSGEYVTIGYGKLRLFHVPVL